MTLLHLLPVCKRTFLSFLILPVVFPVFISTPTFAGNGCPVGGIFKISVPINHSGNDVEERADGSIYSSSTDIELVQDGESQTVGLRFEGLQIPQGAEIHSAYIQFATDEQGSGNCNLEIRAQAADDAGVFQENFQNVSARPLSAGFVGWQPGSWDVIGQSGAQQRTPDLSAILQETINRPGWAEGNAVAFVITGTGRRVAVAYDSGPALAARLEIEIFIPDPAGILEGVYINELMAVNGAIQDDFGEEEDWVEIYNGSDETINLGGLYLTDDASDLKKWRITAPKLIPPGGFGLLWLDADVGQGGLHAPFKLDGGGEFLALVQELNGELALLDAVEFPDLHLNVSYGRLTDGRSGWVFFGEPSHGASNNGKGRFLDEEVIVSKPGGIYPGTVSVQLSVNDPEASIYYTLDGNTPTLNDAQYTQPILISSARVLRARAFKPGFAGGKTATETYILNGNHTIPVVCVQTDPANLWDNQTGIYVSGNSGIQGYCSDLPRNWNQDWERPANITFYEPNGTKGFQVDAGIKIGGGCSRGYKMKSLNVYLRSNKYGDESIDYPLFPGLDVHRFKRFKLRNGGNDFDQMLFRDGINQTILYNTVDLDLMAYRPVVLYLNGEFWGVYEMREFFNEDYVAAHHGADDKNLDIVTNPQLSRHEVNEGSYDAFQTIKDFIQNSDLSIAANYDFLLSRMDMSQYINYHIAEIYLANYDWPANNVRVWRERPDGKFRWMFYDTDATTNYGTWSSSLATDNTLALATSTTGNDWPNGPESTLFLRKLLKNEAFKAEFVQRTATYRKLFFSPERVHQMADSLRQKLSPEMERHISRWSVNAPQWGWGSPSGGSLNAWNNYINTYKSFFVSRSNLIFGHYQSTLSLNGPYPLTFVFDENTPGELFLHSNEVKVPFHFKADYFKGIPLKVKAVAKRGYRFAKWLETGETSASIEFTGTEESTLTPLFVPDAPILTEIHYHPKEGVEYEFLEFYNATADDLELGGFYFSKGIEFGFPAGAVLAPGEYLLVVKDKSRYAALSCQVFQWADGELEDAGETIELMDAGGNIVEQVAYSSSFPWAAKPNGDGSSLSLASPFLDNNTPQNWDASNLDGGSPCGQKPPVEGGEGTRPFTLRIYPNPVADDLKFEYSTLENEPVLMDVVNVLGQLFLNIELEPSPFEQTVKYKVGDWPAGVYFLRIKGEPAAFYRFVKS